MLNSPLIVVGGICPEVDKKVREQGFLETSQKA